MAVSSNTSGSTRNPQNDGSVVRVTTIAGTYQPTHCGVADYTAHLRTALSDRGVRSVVLTTHDAALACDPSSKDFSPHLGKSTKVLLVCSKDFSPHLGKSTKVLTTNQLYNGGQC